MTFFFKFNSFLDEKIDLLIEIFKLIIESNILDDFDEIIDELLIFFQSVECRSKFYDLFE